MSEAERTHPGQRIYRPASAGNPPPAQPVITLKVVGSLTLYMGVVSLVFYAGIAFKEFQDQDKRITNNELALKQLVDVTQTNAQTVASLVTSINDLKSERERNR